MDCHVTIRIQLFALARELVNSDSVSVALPGAEPTVRDLRTALAAQYPPLVPIAATLFIAINRRYASPDDVLRATDEVAAFPPVSGG